MRLQTVVLMFRTNSERKLINERMSLVVEVRSKVGPLLNYHSIETYGGVDV